MIFLGAFFPIVINTVAGVRNLDASLIKAARSFGASDAQIFRTVALPGSVPFPRASGLPSRSSRCVERRGSAENPARKPQTNEAATLPPQINELAETVQSFQNPAAPTRQASQRSHACGT